MSRKRLSGIPSDRKAFHLSGTHRICDDVKKFPFGPEYKIQEACFANKKSLLANASVINYQNIGVNLHPNKFALRFQGASDKTQYSAAVILFSNAFQVTFSNEMVIAFQTFGKQ